MSFLEIHQSFRDVKFIVYRLIWQYRLKNCFDQMFSWMEWNDTYQCWITKRNYYVLCKVFNYRNIEPRESIGESNIIIRRCLFRDGSFQSLMIPDNSGLYFVLLSHNY